MSTRNTQVFITKLAREVTEEDLRKNFRKFGKIKEVTLKRGFGFVDYEDYKCAQDAIDEMHGSKLLGQKIVVEMAGKRKTGHERRTPQPEDKCFRCGRRGHWVSDCTENVVRRRSSSESSRSESSDHKRSRHKRRRDSSSESSSESRHRRHSSRESSDTSSRKSRSSEESYSHKKKSVDEKSQDRERGKGKDRD